jgi:nitrogenase subunit NifH
MARSNKARARRQLAEQVLTISDLDALLCVALKQVASGRMEPGVGSAMATIAKTITTIRSTGDFEKRLEELERASGIGNVRRIGA